MGKRKTEHKQAYFVDYYGNTVEVDRNLVPLLTLLRDFGVRTDYSCEDEYKGRAYLVTHARTILPLLLSVTKIYRNKLYSKSNRQLIKCFLRGNKRFGFQAFGERKIQGMCELHFKERHGSYNYYLEFDLSLSKGLGIIFRWPSLETHRIESLLKETKWLSQK